MSSCGGPRQTRVRAIPQRLQLAGTLLASAVVLVAIYQGRLCTLMTNPEYFPEIDTFKQLADSGLDVKAWTMGMTNLVRFPTAEEFGENELESRLRVSKRVLPIYSMKEMDRLVLKKRKFAYVGHDFELMLTLNEFEGNDWKSMRIMKEAAHTTYQAMHTRWNWPWIELFNKHIQRFVEAGLPNFWESDFIRLFSIAQRILGRYRFNKTETSDVEHNEYEAFTLNDTMPHFGVLCLGLVLSAVSLIIEMTQGHYNKQRIIKKGVVIH